MEDQWRSTINRYQATKYSGYQSPCSFHHSQNYYLWKLGIIQILTLLYSTAKACPFKFTIIFSSFIKT